MTNLRTGKKIKGRLIAQGLTKEQALKLLNGEGVKKAMDWEKAKDHLDRVMEQYKALARMPNVNPYFALGAMSQIKKRYDSGERTKALYDAITGLE